MLLDSTCYTGCTQTTTVVPNGSGVPPVSHSVSALPFTGADIVEMIVLGVALVVVGVVMLRALRLRRAR